MLVLLAYLGCKYQRQVLGKAFTLKLKGKEV
jgi:hypothetical protein